RVLADDPSRLTALEQAYAQEAQPFLEANATLAPAQAAARKLQRAEARVKALERRGILPTERSYELYDAETGAPVNPAAVAPVAPAAQAQVSTAPAWMQAAGLAPAASG